MITTLEVQQVLEEGEIIEYYSKDVRGPCCLILGFRKNKQTVHVVCSPKNDYLTKITAYIPDKQLWANNFKERKQ